MTSQVDRYLQHNPEKTNNGIHLKVPVAPVVQLVTSKPSDVGTWDRISVQSHDLGFFLTKIRIKNNA